MVIIGSIGVQREKANVHHLDTSTLAAIRAPDEASMSDEEGGEELAVSVLRQLGGVEPAVRNSQDGFTCLSCVGGVDPAVPPILVSGKAPDHHLTHKPTDPACDACIRGKMKGPCASVRGHSAGPSSNLVIWSRWIAADFNTRGCNTR